MSHQFLNRKQLNWFSSTTNLLTFTDHRSIASIINILHIFYASRQCQRTSLNFDRFLSFPSPSFFLVTCTWVGTAGRTQTPPRRSISLSLSFRRGRAYSPVIGMGSVEDTETCLVDGDGDSSSRVAQQGGGAGDAGEGSEIEVHVGGGEERQREDEAMASPPKDRYWLSWFIFCLLGMGCLLPWNFFISGE